MSEKKAFLFRFLTRKSFLFKINKKLLALFIFMSLSVNGFAPSAAEVSKYSFIMTVAAITQNMAMHIIERCDLALADMASEMYYGFFNALEGTPLGSHDNNAQKEKSSPHAGSAERIIIKQATFNEKIKVLKDNTFFFGALNCVLFEKLGLGSEKFNTGLLSAIFIVFLMFIIAITRRKDIVNVNRIINIKRRGFSA